MIEERAVVTRLNNGQVWIRRLQSGACGACAQQSSCGTATLSQLLPKREFAVDCPIDVKAGDSVVVAIDDAHLLATSLLLYGLPLLAMFLVVGIAAWFPVVDTWLPEIALGSLLLAFLTIHRFQAVFLLHFCFKPQVVRREG